MRKHEKVAVFGDIGGHFHPFMKALEILGVDIDNAVVPEGLTIVQVGDLVHRGPDSDLLVAWVNEALLGDSKGKWVQLLGNHEGHHIGGPEFSSFKGDPWELSSHSVEILKGWKKNKLAHMAASLETATKGDALITHAGLCSDLWENLDRPASARAAALHLNCQTTHDAFAPGWMLGEYYQSRHGGIVPPGVAWASAGKEVYPSWLHVDAPFSQIHGHSTLWNWAKRQSYLNEAMTERLTFYPESRHTCWLKYNRNVSPGPSVAAFWGVDPGLGKYSSSFPIVPLERQGIVLTPC